jgi:hypothetical protein
MRAHAAAEVLQGVAAGGVRHNTAPGMCVVLVCWCLVTARMRSALLPMEQAQDCCLVVALHLHACCYCAYGSFCLLQLDLCVLLMCVLVGFVSSHFPG